MLSQGRIAFLTSIFLMAWTPFVSAQLMRPPEQPKAPEFLAYEPDSAGLKQALSEMRVQLKAMHAAEIRYHNSDTPAEESRYKNEWYTIRETIHDHEVKVLNAAVEEYMTDIIGKAALGTIILKSLKRNVEKDCFDGMYSVAKNLIDANYPDPELPRIYTQCCLAENEFEIAKQTIDSADFPPELLNQLRGQLDQFAKNWTEEQEARKRDLAGEPLPQARIVTTKGDVIVELFENEAPEAVASFINLAERGFYDYTDFFMVISHFAAQAGCPNEDGSGGPGYMLKDENEHPNARKLFRGSLVLATLKGRPNSGGSQFYIPYLPTVAPDQKHAVFGRVISGMQNLANLNRVDPQKKKEDEEGKEDKEPKLPPDEIVKIEIIRKRNHPYEPTRLPVAGLNAPIPAPSN